MSRFVVGALVPIPIYPLLLTILKVFQAPPPPPSQKPTSVGAEVLFPINESSVVPFGKNPPAPFASPVCILPFTNRSMLPAPPPTMSSLVPEGGEVVPMPTLPVLPCIVTNGVVPFMEVNFKSALLSAVVLAPLSI
jgi:hypothetical protein